MKKLLRIFNSGWFLLLAMAVLIIGGRTKSGGMLWSGTVLLLLGAAAGIRDCIRRLRALRHKIRQRPGMENAGFWSAIREEIREETKAARTAAETARTAGIPDPETAPEETEITATANLTGFAPLVKRETFPQGKILIHIKQPSLSSKPQASSLRMVHDTHHRVVRQKVICSVMTETGETRISHQHTVLIITKPQIAFLVLIDVTDTPGIRQQMFRK